jgi:hypothetical protein
MHLSRHLLAALKYAQPIQKALITAIQGFGGAMRIQKRD